MSQSQQTQFPKHSTSIQIRFNDIDGLGHVNNSVYAQYFDMGRQSYFEFLNNGPMDWQKAGLIIASTHTDFIFPIFLRDNICVGTSITKIGNKSLQMTQVIYDPHTEQIKAKCMSVMVGFDLKTNSSVLIPDLWRERINAFENE